jgi:hypothetical protein
MITERIMVSKHELEAGDILPAAEYAKIRADERKRMVELKRRRRIEVGPCMTFYFECYDTMRHQVHEMLHIEKGGAPQLSDELAAYNPLVPKGNELVATVMIEIDDPVRRKETLGRLGGIENALTLSIAGEVVRGDAETDQERTTEEGKASSVQFVHFRLTPPLVPTFKVPGTRVIVGCDHASYGHMAVMPEAMRAELARDLD